MKVKQSQSNTSGPLGALIIGLWTARHSYFVTSAEQFCIRPGYRLSYNTSYDMTLRW